jgi:hypothetical protein
VRGERRPPGPVQVPGQPGDAAEDLERFDVKVGALGTPARDQFINLVGERICGCGDVGGTASRSRAASWTAALLLHGLQHIS